MNETDLLKSIGKSIKHIRLSLNMTYEQLSDKSLVSIDTIKYLEQGGGFIMLNSLVSILNTLKKDDWIKSLHPYITINPLHMVKNKPRKRASGVKTKKSFS